MKCEHCGADYKADALTCPYCGAENRIGQEWKAQKQHATQQKEETKRFVIHSMPLYIINRIVNTILALGIALAVLTVAITAVVFFFEEKVEKHTFASASLDEAEVIYQTGDYVKLDEYLTENEVWSWDEDDTFEKYKDAVTLYNGWTMLKKNILRYYGASEEKIKDNPEYGPVYNVFEDCQELLSQSTYYYRIDCEENMPLYDEYARTVKAFLTGELLLTEDELEDISNDYMTMDEKSKWVCTIYERKGWTANGSD